MADVFKMKVGTNTNMGLRNIGHIDSSSLARLAESRRDNSGSGGTGEYIFNFNSFDRSNTLGYGIGLYTFPEEIEQIFNDNSGFRAYINNEMKTRLAGEFGGQYERGLREGDGILIADPAMTNSVNYYFKYTDLRTVQKLTYKGNPVFRLKKNGVTTFQRQVASGAETKVGLATRTMTSITWRVTNDDDANILADVYAATGTSYPSVSTLYSSGSNPTGTLNNSYKKNSTKIAGGNYFDFTTTGLTPNTSYRCTAVLGDNTTSLYHSVPGQAALYTSEGIVVSFVSATSTSITFNYTNRTSSSTTRIYAGTTSPGNTQVSSTSVAPNGNIYATLTGLSPNTNYTIYVRGYYGSTYTYTTTASFTGKTLSSLQKPDIISTNGNYCEPGVEIHNPNNVTVTVVAGGGVNPTTTYGTLTAYETRSFYIYVGDNTAGQTKTVYVRLYNTSQGYSDSSHSSVTISNRCISNPGN